MSLFEFLYIGFYLGFLTAIIVMLQLLEVVKITQTTNAKKVDLPQEEDEDEETPTKLFDPQNEPYTMTENPMFRHRTTRVDQTS
jgi:hypothetical protein